MPSTESNSTSTPTRPPWQEFWDSNSFSRPVSLHDATARLKGNLAHFELNYLTLVFFILTFCCMYLFIYYTAVPPLSGYIFSMIIPLSAIASTKYCLTLDKRRYPLLVLLLLIIVLAFVVAHAWILLLIFLVSSSSFVILHDLLKVPLLDQYSDGLLDPEFQAQHDESIV